MAIKTTVRIEVVPDNNADASYLEQPGFETRLAQYHAGDFAFVGVRVDVESWDKSTGVITRTTTAGLWGVESDSDEDWLRTIASDEATTLAGVDVTGAPIVWRV